MDFIETDLGDKIRKVNITEGRVIYEMEMRKGRRIIKLTNVDFEGRPEGSRNIATVVSTKDAKVYIEKEKEKDLIVKVKLTIGDKPELIIPEDNLNYTKEKLEYYIRILG